MLDPQTIRIFISSPSDVADERANARKVIDQLNYEDGLRDHFSLKALAWEQVGVPMPANQSAQLSVDTYVKKPSGCHVVIVIFWSRMGTPMEMNGEKYLSGTHYEFIEAMQGAEEKGLPLVLVYKRTEPINFSSNDPDIFTKIEQHKKVQDFFADFNNADGSIKHPYKEYELPSNFAELLEKDLKAYLFHLRDNPKPPTETEIVDETISYWQGSPFPGLKAFTANEAPIFFGRGRETDALVKRVKDVKTRFTAVVGASGSGKSSLVGAGLIPRLQDTSEKQWQIVRFTPDYLGLANPFVSLASALKSDLGIDQRDLPKQLHDDANLLNDLLSARTDDSQILLFIDQFEELFTTVLEEYRQAFVDMLTGVQANENVRTVVTLRGDFYGRCIELPALADLLETSTYPLSRPSQIALHEMITRPALRAGLTFDDGLVQQILDDTGEEPGALALMAYALDELYKIAEKRDDKNLSFADYEALGRVQGAIGERAEAVFDALEIEDAGKVLEGVFLHLIRVDENLTATRRRELKEKVATTPETELLVNAFTDARLLVQSRGKNNTIYVEVAHEALLRSWGRLANWIAEAGDGLRLLHEAENDAKRWEKAGKPDYLLWKQERQNPLYEVQKQLGIEFAPLVREFIKPETHRLWDQAVDIATNRDGFEVSFVEDHRIRTIIDRLVEIGDRGVFFLVRLLVFYQLQRDDDHLIAVLRNNQERAVPLLISALEEKFSLLRRNSAKVLGILNDKRAVVPLTQLLQDSESNVRFVSVQSLEQLDDKRAIEPLILVLGDPDKSVRVETIKALAKSNDKRVVDYLIQILGDPDNSVRLEGAKALGTLGGKQAVEPLILLLQDDDVNIRSSSAESLGKLRDKRAIDPLIRLLDDANSNVKRASVLALGLIGDERVVMTLLKLLKDIEISYSREEISIDEIEQALQNLANTQTTLLFIKALNRLKGDKKDAIVRILGNVGDKRAVDPLKKLLDPQLRTFNRFASIQPKLPLAISLVKLGELQYISVIYEELSAKIPDQRIKAIDGLGEIGNPEAISKLIVMLDDDDQEVQESAVNTLKKFDIPEARDAVEEWQKKNPTRIGGRFGGFSRYRRRKSEVKRDDDMPF